MRDVIIFTCSWHSCKYVRLVHWPTQSGVAIERTFAAVGQVVEDLRLGQPSTTLPILERMSILPIPKEDLGRPNEPFVDLSECVVEALFKDVSTGFGLLFVEKGFDNAFWKVYKRFIRPSQIFVWGAYISDNSMLPTQTKIWEGWAKDDILIFDWLFNGS